MKNVMLLEPNSDSRTDQVEEVDEYSSSFYKDDGSSENNRQHENR